MPQFNQGLEIFANWQTVVFCLSIFILTQFLRRVVEKWPTTKNWSADNWIWRELFLPFGPIAVGMILAVSAREFPWPILLGTALSSKLMYGVACGTVCSWLYARVKALFGVAADKGNTFAAKVLKRPVTIPPPPMGEDQGDPVEADSSTEI